EWPFLVSSGEEEQGRSPEQEECAACGVPAVETYRGLWLCRSCFDTMTPTNEQPFMIDDDPAAAQDKHPTARRWEEWRQLEQQPGGSSEPNQEPIRPSPVLHYTNPPVSGQRSTPETPIPIQDREPLPDVQGGHKPELPRDRKP